jgi:hypothetical protein
MMNSRAFGGLVWYSKCPIKPNIEKVMEREDFHSINKPRNDLRLPTKKSYKWSEQETNRLVELKQKYPNESWEFIGSLMEGRTVSACQFRWYVICRNQMNINAPLKWKVWTAEETSKLIDLKTSYYNESWKFIANLMGGSRSSIACQTIWYSKYRKLFKEQWTKNDLEKLTDLKSKYPEESWEFIASEMGRDVDFCLFLWDIRYKKQLGFNTHSSCKYWSEEDKKNLFELKTKYHNQSWEFIANLMNKTASDCRELWYYQEEQPHIVRLKFIG